MHIFVCEHVGMFVSNLGAEEGERGPGIHCLRITQNHVQ